MIERRTRQEEIHSTAFSARIEAVEALQAAGLGSLNDAARLSSAAAELRLTAHKYGDAPSGAIYSAFADLVEMVGFLVDWRAAVLNAGTDAQRFVTAAKERATAWSEKYNSESSLAMLRAAANAIDNIQSISQVATTAVHLAAIPLPIGLYSLPRRNSRPVNASAGAEERKTTDLTVAFLKFTIDGTPVAETHYVSPGETHDLDIEVRVSRWPASATALVLEPVSIEPSGTYQLPTFSIDAPMGDGPFRLRQKGRALLTVPQHFSARPFEFKYVAHFVPATCEQPVDTAGQRTLLLEGVDLSRHPVTGYRNLDRKLVAIRDQLRTASGIGQQELADALTLAAPLANLAGQGMQDNLFKSVISESEFQAMVRQFLRGRPNIGAELEEHPRAAGGITDLSYRGIRLELKVEDTQNMALQDCDRFLAQTASYVVANGKRIGLLCVLDCSAKKRPAFPADDGIDILVHQQSETPIHVIAILIQGNLAAPSSFSR
jgi:hypothetical protein